MTAYYIGWDVGAWHCAATGETSKDALAILNGGGQLVGDYWEGNLSQVVLNASNAQGPGFLAELFTLCNATPPQANSDTFCIAIDTPLGWPTAFTKLLAAWERTVEDEGHPVPREVPQITLSKGKINNPLLHRQCETALKDCLSAVQDSLGSQSTKGISLLMNLGASRVSTGVWRTTQPPITFIETYPAPCMRSLSFHQHVRKRKLPFRQPRTVDTLDALVCAVVAEMYVTAKQSLAAPRECDQHDSEGWIFIPNDCLDAKFGVSYGRLLRVNDPQQCIIRLLDDVHLAIWMETFVGQATPAARDRLQPWCAAWNQHKCDNQRAATTAGLEELFRLLHPKTAEHKVPDDEKFNQVINSLQPTT